MGILRTIVVISGLTAFIPSPPEDTAQMASGASGNEAGAGYVQVAVGTFSDLASFCDRQPAVCKTAGYVAYKLERKAKYGVRMIYEWANEASPERPNLATSSDPIKTSSTKTAFAQQPGFVSQSTLRIEDLIPVWLGPKNSKSS
jgi:Family of unknown function (DUF5330)